MGVSLYPVFEREVDGYDVCSVNGKPLARAIDKHPALEALMQFYSISPIEVAGWMGLLDDWDGEGEPDLSAHDLPSEEWYELAAGLAAVHRAVVALQDDTPETAALRDAPGTGPDWIVHDLRAIEAALQNALRQEVRFHLAMDPFPLGDGPVMSASIGMRCARISQKRTCIYSRK